MLEISDHISTISYGRGSIESKISIFPIVHVVLHVNERFKNNKTECPEKIAKSLKKTSEVVNYSAIVVRFPICQAGLQNQFIDLIMI